MKDIQSAARPVDQRIIAFLQSQTALSMATSNGDLPHCASCFYAYNEEHNVLVFKSSLETVHVQDAIRNPRVAGTILPDKLVTGKVKGIQFSGVLTEPKDPLLADIQRTYYKKYPFAIAISGDMWAIKLTWIKFTDNTLGFGKKTIWEEA